MAKSRKLEALQAQLSRLREQPVTDDAIAQLRSILRSPHAIVVAQAAKFVAELERRDLMPDLVDAFDRFMQNPASTDPNCHAKSAIADALYRFNYNTASLFLQGIHHVQMEPIWGGTVDTAPALRGICAMGLVRMNYADVMTELADLLADPEIPARIAAARAIAYNGSSQGIPLLRLRVKLGDEPHILSEYVSALLTLDAERSLDIVTQVLHTGAPQTQELVALALAESHCDGALNILKGWWTQTPDPELRKTGLLAIAMVRSDEAIQFLLATVRDGSQQDSAYAVDALRIYEHNPAIWDQVCTFISDRSQP